MEFAILVLVFGICAVYLILSVTARIISAVVEGIQARRGRQEEEERQALIRLEKQRREAGIAKLRAEQAEARRAEEARRQADQVRRRAEAAESEATFKAQAEAYAWEHGISYERARFLLGQMRAEGLLGGLDYYEPEPESFVEEEIEATEAPWDRHWRTIDELARIRSPSPHDDYYERLDEFGMPYHLNYDRDGTPFGAIDDALDDDPDFDDDFDFDPWD